MDKEKLLTVGKALKLVSKSLYFHEHIYIKLRNFPSIRDGLVMTKSMKLQNELKILTCVALVVSPQALELREGCSCPALPTTDPRAVFSKTVQALLEKNKGKGEQEGAHKASLIYGLASVPTGLPAGLLAANSLPTSSNVDQENKEPGSTVDSE